MDKNASYVLIHSPLAGPLTWESVRREMQQCGLTAIVPELRDGPHSTQAYWHQHAGSIARVLTRIARDREMVLVAHSGAGALLPALRTMMGHSILAYVFVDAGIPRDGLSRLDLMRLQDQAWADQFHQALLRGERFPTWDDDDLREVIPDDRLRREMLAEVRPRALEFFSEPIPVFSGWPDAPCAYIKFSTSYEWDFDQAKQAGWRLRQVDAGHFHMLVDPSAVADIIIEVVQEFGHHEAR
jgi:pimeloyl-ACP methyl ester carboxylesterase